MPPEDDDIDPNAALSDAIASLPANAEPEPEAPAEPEAAVEAPAPVEAVDKAASGRLSDLIAERQRRKALEAELAELRQRVQQHQQPPPVAAAPPPAPEAPTVKFEDSPAEWLRQNTEIQARRLEAHEKELQARVKAYEEEVQREQQHRQQVEYIQRLDDEYRNVWADRAQQDPPALEARNFLANQFIEEAMAIGRTWPQANQMLIQAERQMAYEAFTNELNPVDLIVARARARGWTPGQATGVAAVQPQPAVAAPASAMAPAAAQRRGSIGSKLSAASGAVAPTMPTLHEIASMPRDEYGRWRKKNPDGFEKLIGAA